MPAGRGLLLRQDMFHLVEELVGSLPAALDGEEFKARVRQIEHAFEAHQAEAINALREKSLAQQVKLYEQPGEFSFAPLRDGQVLDMQAFSAFLPAVHTYLDSVEQAVIHNTRDFLRREGADALAAGDHGAFRSAVLPVAVL
jgi:hypothetical protein